MPAKTRPCPGCRQERHPTQFIADSPYCQGCRDLGPQYPVEEGKGPSAERIASEETTMTMKGSRVECPWCHKMKANLSEHKKTSKARPDGAQVPKKRQGRPQAKGPSEPAKPAKERENGCQVCGLNVAERELVGEGIRLGMSFDNSVAFVRHARAVGGREKSA